jgi:hypothetical protein
MLGLKTKQGVLHLKKGVLHLKRWGRTLESAPPFYYGNIKNQKLETNLHFIFDLYTLT